MKISIVVPVHNEAGNILPLVEEIERAMTQAEAYEIIYVDDGSRDQTEAELKDAMQRFKALRVIRHRQSCGQSTAGGSSSSCKSGSTTSRGSSCGSRCASSTYGCRIIS